MNISKSLRIAMVKQDRDLTWLAGQLKCSKPNASRIMTKGSASQERIEELAGLFGMKTSDFIALGED